MNYRHAFHAGNHGDVLKHVLLTRVLRYLTEKATPLAVLDAYAGIGRYDLMGPEALKTSEWRSGIGRLLGRAMGADIEALLQPYLDTVRHFNPDGTLRVYPGSPVLAKLLLRPHDRLLLNELHPQDHDALKLQFAAERRVWISCLDATKAVKAALPFIEKRGLVLIDPAFEVTDESARVADMVAQALQRMAQVCLMIWYPVTTQAFADDFCQGLKHEGAKAALRAELLVRPPQQGGGLAGSGVVIINPPWTLHAELEKILPALTHVLGEGGQGSFKLDWMKKPS